MGYNTAMFKKVHDQITERPELHSQADWEYTLANGCGTTRCVGGWTLHFLNPGLPVSDVASLLDEHGRTDRAAAQVLGLNEAEADHLFYNTTEEEAVDMCAFYAGLRPDRPSYDAFVADMNA